MTLMARNRYVRNFDLWARWVPRQATVLIGERGYVGADALHLQPGCAFLMRGQNKIFTTCRGRESTLVGSNIFSIFLHDRIAEFQRCSRFLGRANHHLSVVPLVAKGRYEMRKMLLWRPVGSEGFAGSVLTPSTA